MTSGTSISPPFPLRLGSGPPGLPAPCLRCGHSAGGWSWPSTTARGASWASQSSVTSPPPRPFGGLWSASSGASAIGPGTWSPTRAASSSPGTSSAGVTAEACTRDSAPSADTAAGPLHQMEFSGGIRDWYPRLTTPPYFTKCPTAVKTSGVLLVICPQTGKIASALTARPL